MSVGFEPGGGLTERSLAHGSQSLGALKGCPRVLVGG